MPPSLAKLASMPAHGHGPCLLDLSDDALLSIASHLGPALQDRLALTATCRRLRALGASSSLLWRHVSFSTSKKRLARVGREHRLLFAESLAGTFARSAQSGRPLISPLSCRACVHVACPPVL